MASPAKAKDFQLRLLIIDDPGKKDEHLPSRFQEAGYEPQVLRVADSGSFRSALRTQSWDAVLYKQHQPGFTAYTALRLMQELGFDLPFIIVADNIDDRNVIRAMRAGAHDCIPRDSMPRLVSVVERRVRDARQRADHRAALEMLKESEARFRALASNLPEMIFQLQRDKDGHLSFLYVSEGCHKLFGLKQTELLARPRRFTEAIVVADRAILERAMDVSAASFTPLNWEGRIRTRGQAKWIDLRSIPQRLDSGELQWQGIVTDITQSKEIEAELRRSREQLSELSYHLEGAKEEERERIARDIHDELGSTLVAIKIETSLLASKLAALPGLRDKAHSIEALVDRAMNTISRVARELRPGILKEFGLPAAIEQQIEDFNQRTGIACRVKCDDEWVEPNEKTSLALFRILQETLTNIAKHAHASLVVVRLRRNKGSMLLEVRDNGRGISEADMSKPKSFGLRGIRERVHSLGGEFSIETAEHGGTYLRLRVPDVSQVETAAMPEEEPQRNLF